MTNKLLVTGNSDKSIKIWSWKKLKKSKCIKTIKIVHSSFVYSLLELPGNILVSGCVHGHIKFWNFNFNYRNFKIIRDYINSLVMIHISQKELATTDYNNIKVYNINIAKC